MSVCSKEDTFFRDQADLTDTLGNQRRDIGQQIRKAGEALLLKERAQREVEKQIAHAPTRIGATTAQRAQETDDNTRLLADGEAAISNLKERIASLQKQQTALDGPHRHARGFLDELIRSLDNTNLEFKAELRNRRSEQL
jgi:septal ring factor EnvC (AmiA/AmiB activator)